MKTTQECWQALIDGETLITRNGNTVRLEGGFTVDQGGRIDYWRFDKPSMWSIYTPPKWYENIPDGGVLCWVSDADSSPDSGNYFAWILKYSAGQGFATKTGAVWKHAAPLTKQEIHQLLDNAPEGEGE